MSLPSQSSRNATRSSQVHYRRSSASPIRKLFTLLVIVGFCVLVWFTLIRPRASKLVAGQEQTDSAQVAQNNQPNAQPTGIENQPVVINNSPSRPLPGSTINSDPVQDVSRTINAHTPATATNTDILGAAVDANNSTPNTSSATQTQPRTTPQTQPRSTSASGIRLQLDSARRLVAQNNRVGARKLLSQTLLAANTTHNEAQVLRDELTAINEVLVFSPSLIPTIR